MKNRIVLALMILFTAGCMQDYPENASGNDGYDKACNLIAYQSTIAVQYADGEIPKKLSAWVNGMAVVNECTMGTDNSSYLTVRTADTLTLLLRVDGNAAMNEMFFNEDGTPKTNVRFQLVMKGRDVCSDSPDQFFTTNTSLNWKPVYSNNNKNCAPSGYTATVSN